jgi:hypothetical protein
MKQKRRSIEDVNNQIARMQEQMNDKSHGGQSGGRDSSKSLEKLTALYAERRKLLGV